jgi:hypothetical protein
MSDHVPVEAALALPGCYCYVEDYLRGVDALLRLRRSANHRGFFVLERRVRRSRPPETARRDLSDQHVQARDGYVHVTTVHPWYLDRPQRIVDKLREDDGDWHAPGNSAAQWWARQEAQASAEKAQRSEARYREFRDFYRDSLDAVARTDGTRIQHPGRPPGSLAGETPAQEVSSEHQTPSEGRREDGRLHDQAPGG